MSVVPAPNILLIVSEDHGYANRGGLGLVSVRATLTRLTGVVQSFVDQGVLAHNVIALVKHPRQTGDANSKRHRTAPSSP